MITKDYLKLVVSGEKKLLPMSSVRPVNIPMYDELRLSLIYPKALELDGMKDYFPSSYVKGRTVDRTYFWQTFNSLHPNVVKSLLDHANS